MAVNELSPTDCLEFIEEESVKTVAMIELADAEIPRAGEHVRLNANGGPVTYEVSRVMHYYGRRWKAGSPSLLKVSVFLKT